MSNEERLKKLLSDLGKATLRGVRKCPKCGTYNGSRGLCCKNKYCDAVFKEPGEKRKLSTEACKLITGSTVQVFSVRVKDKGPDYRGFVQLPLINTTISNNITALISQTTALCFVDSCERSFHTSVLKCHVSVLYFEICISIRFCNIYLYYIFIYFSNYFFLRKKAIQILCLHANIFKRH